MASRLIAYSETIDLADPIWQPRHYDFNLFSEDKIEEKLTYMHQNPVRAGLVQGPCDWPWCSARYYEQVRSVGVPISWLV
jgi:putative transposase